MPGASLIYRGIAIILTATMCSSASFTQTLPQTRALKDLYKTAKNRDKQVAKERKEAHNLVLQAQRLGLRAHGNGLREASDLYWDEKAGYEAARAAAAREHEFLRKIAQMERYGLPNPIQLTMLSQNHARRMQRLDDQSERARTTVRVRLSLAKRDSTDQQALRLMQRAVDAYQYARAALDRERATYDMFFEVLDQPSVSEVARSDRERQERQRAASQRRELERQRARNYVTAMIAAVGLATAAAIVLKLATTNASESERQEMQNRVHGAGPSFDALEFQCVATGGVYMGGGGCVH